MDSLSLEEEEEEEEEEELFMLLSVRKHWTAGGHKRVGDREKEKKDAFVSRRVVVKFVLCGNFLSSLFLTYTRGRCKVVNGTEKERNICEFPACEKGRKVPIEGL